MNISSIFRGFFVGLLGYLLIAFIYLTANSITFVLITSNSAQVKQIVANSGSYEKITPLILSELSKQKTKGENDIPFEDPRVQTVANKVLDGAKIQSLVEPVIDGTYSWLNGTTPEPKFSVDIKSIQKDFVTNLIDSELKRLQKLPVCSISQMQANQNLLNTKCRPPYPIDRESLIRESNQNLHEKNDVLTNATISAKDIKDPEGQPIYEKIAKAPEIFQFGKKLPWITGFLAILTSIGLFFISGSHRRGLKHLGISYTIAGILLLVIPSTNNLITSQSLSSLKSQSFEIYSVVQPIMKSFNEASAHIYYITGVIVLILAAISFSARYWLFQKETK